MYKLSDIKRIHLEITSKCQASCPMCSRNMQGGPVNPWLIEDEITIEQFKEWFSPEFIKQLTVLYVCGNLGDAIVAKDTLAIFQYLRKHNPNLFLELHTNGSAKSKQWWEDLAKENVRVTFGIDGLADTHSLYRIGTVWDKIIENARAFIAAGGSANWHMLIFDHNKHQVEQCEALSVELGFREFKAKNSARFKDTGLVVLTKKGTTSHILYPTDRSIEIRKNVVDSIQSAPVITCKAKEENSLYIGANGNLTPCCWLDMPAGNPTYSYIIDYANKIGMTPNLKVNTLEEIMSSEYFNKIENLMGFDPLIRCATQCGKVSPTTEQFK